MKRTLKSRYQLLLLVFFTIFIVESALILLALVKPEGIEQIRSSIHSIVILFILVQFIYFVLLFYYIPFKLEKGLREVYKVLEDVSEGKYEIDLDLKTVHQYGEIADLITALQKMMTVVIRFDHLKADKIFEQHQRIQLLLDMLPQGCLVLSSIGEIIYINDFIKDKFPELTEHLNIIEILLPRSIEDELKPLILNSIKNGESLHDKTFNAGDELGTFVLNSSIIRSRKGHTIGAVFVITSARDNA